MKNGCFDRKPFVWSYPVQDGYHPSGERRMKMADFRMERDCQYRDTELGKADKGCVGCEHKQTGEKDGVS